MQKKNIETIANEKSERWIVGTWLCRDCYDNKPGNKKNKEPNKSNIEKNVYIKGGILRENNQRRIRL
jgi:hypothetical protein